MKKKVFLFGLLFSLLLLCGCGVNLTSTVKLNKDFSGTRVMSCTFSSRDFHSYFKGSKEDLNKLIKESCPDALTYTSSSSYGNKWGISIFISDLWGKIKKITNFLLIIIKRRKTKIESIRIVSVRRR